MDERRDRSRAGHRVRQPHKERDLGRLASRADKEEQRDSRHGPKSPDRLWRKECRLLEKTGHSTLGDETDRSKGGEDQKHRDHVSEIADAVGDEGLLRRVASLLPANVVANQQVRAETDSLPTHKEQEQVVGQHQRQHHEHEEVEIGEEAVVARVSVHVAGGIDVNQQTDAGDEENVDSRERIEQIGEIGLEVPHLDPGEEVLGDDPLSNRERQQFGEEDRKGEQS